MNDNFTPSDSDLVFRRKERWVLVAVVFFELLLFTGIFFGVIMKGNPREIPIIGGIFVANLVFLSVVAYWMWTYEVRITPYELVIRTFLGAKAIPFSMIVGVERVKVQGKTPETFVLKVRTSEDQRLTLPDSREGVYGLHDELRARCKALARLDDTASDSQKIGGVF